MNQKLFHKEEASLSEHFVPFAISDKNKTAASFQESNVHPLRNQAFGLPDKFWDWVRHDSELQKALDAMIEVRVQDRLRAESEEYKSKVKMEAQKEGVAQGIKLSESELSEIKMSLQSVLTSIKEEKEKLLKEHSNTWVKLLEKTCKLFFREVPNLLNDSLIHFFEEKISEFHIEGSLEVQCSEKIFSQLSQLEILSPNLKFKNNPQLSGNAFKVSWLGGQILFDESIAMNSLTELFASVSSNPEDKKV